MSQDPNLPFSEDGLNKNPPIERTTARPVERTTARTARPIERTIFHNERTVSNVSRTHNIRLSELESNVLEAIKNVLQKDQYGHVVETVSASMIFRRALALYGQYLQDVLQEDPHMVSSERDAVRKDSDLRIRGATQNLKIKG